MMNHVRAVRGKPRSRLLICTLTCLATCYSSFGYSREDYRFRVIPGEYSEKTFELHQCSPCHFSWGTEHTDYGAAIARALRYKRATGPDLWAAIRETDFTSSLVENKTYGELRQSRGYPGFLGKAITQIHHESANDVLSSKGNSRPVPLEELWGLPAPVNDFRSLLILVANPAPPAASAPYVWRRFDREGSSDNEPSAHTFDSQSVARARDHFRRIQDQCIPAIADAILSTDDLIRTCAIASVDHLRRQNAELIYNYVIPRLCASLKNHDQSMRKAACEALALASDRRPAVIEALADALVGDSDAAVRAAAARALGDIGVCNPPTLSALGKGLRDAEWLVRYRAVAALESFGQRSLPLLSDLAVTLRDPVWQVRHRAAAALCLLGNIAIPYAATIAAVIDSESAHELVGWDKIAAFRALYVNSSTIALLHAFNAASPTIQLAITQILATRGTQSDVAHTLAEVAASRSSPVVRLASMRALATLHVTDDRALRSLTELLLTGDATIADSCSLLERWEPTSHAFLQRLLISQNPIFRASAAALLGKLRQDRDSQEALAALLTKDLDATVRATAISSLAERKELDNSLILTGLRDSDRTVRVAVVKELQHSNIFDDGEIVKRLLTLASDVDSELSLKVEILTAVRNLNHDAALRYWSGRLHVSPSTAEIAAALRGLADLGAKARFELPEVLKLAGGGEARIRFDAVTAIGKIASSGDPPSSALQRALRDDTKIQVNGQDVTIAAAAADACLRLGPSACFDCAFDLVPLARSGSSTAVHALAQSRERAALIVPYLATDSYSRDGDETLVEIAHLAAPILVDIIRGADARTRRHVAYLFGRMQSECDVIIDPLLHLLADVDKDVRDAAQWALIRLPRRNVEDSMPRALANPAIFIGASSICIDRRLGSEPIIRELFGVLVTSDPQIERRITPRLPVMRAFGIGFRLAALKALETSREQDAQLVRKVGADIAPAWSAVLFFKYPLLAADRDPMSETLIHSLSTNDTLLRSQAIDKLTTFAMRDLEVRRSLFRTIPNLEPATRFLLVNRLSEKGALDADILFPMLTDRDANCRTLAVDALARAPGTRTADLCGLARSADLAVRGAALEAIMRGAPTDEAIASIRAALQDADLPSRCRASQLIGRFPTMAALFRDQLLLVAEAPRENSIIRAACLLALSASARPTPPILELYRQCLDKRNAIEVRLASIQALGRCGPIATSAAGTLAELLKDSNECLDVRLSAARALRDLDPSPPDVLDILLANRRNPDATVAESAWSALGALGRYASAAVQDGPSTGESSQARCARGQISGDNWRMPWQDMQARSSVPSFDPVPSFSNSESFDLGALFGDHVALGTVYHTISDGLRAEGFGQRQLGFRDGFALISQFERFEPESLKSSSTQRWYYGKVTPPFFSSAFLHDLFRGQEGNFRCFAFLVASTKIRGQGVPTWTEAAALYEDGLSGTLDATIADQECRGLQCHAVVYHYRSRDGDSYVLQSAEGDGTPPADLQLRGAGLEVFSGLRTH